MRIKRLAVLHSSHTAPPRLLFNLKKHSFPVQERALAFRLVESTHLWWKHYQPHFFVFFCMFVCLLFDIFSISYTTTMDGFSSLLPGQAVSLRPRQQAGKSLFRGEAGNTSNIGLAQSLYLKRVSRPFGVSHTPRKSPLCSSPQLLWLGGPAEGGEGNQAAQVAGWHVHAARLAQAAGWYTRTCVRSSTCASWAVHICAHMLALRLCKPRCMCALTPDTPPPARAAQFQIGTSW